MKGMRKLTSERRGRADHHVGRSGRSTILCAANLDPVKRAAGVRLDVERTGRESAGLHHLDGALFVVSVDAGALGHAVAARLTELVTGRHPEIPCHAIANGGIRAARQHLAGGAGAEVALDIACVVIVA